MDAENNKNKDTISSIFADLNAHEGTQIIKNYSAFDEKYIPEKIEFRMEQIKQIARVMHLSQFSKNILKIDGDYGTGKTMTVIKIQQEFLRNTEYQDIPAIYINVGEFMTRYKILSQIYTLLCPESKKRKNGYPDTFFIEKINDKLLKYAGVILILDEVDKAITREGDSILYVLLEMQKLSLILISNFPRWEEKVSGAVFSRLRRGGRMHFPKYDIFELEKILENRAKEALNEGTYTSEVIAYIAEKIHTEGDARSLIELLRISAQIASEQSGFAITKEQVNQAKLRLDRKLIEDNLREQNIHKRILLLSIATKQDNRHPGSPDDIYSSYLGAMIQYNTKYPEQINSLSKPSIYRLLDELLGQGIIEKEKGFYAKGVGRKPYIYKSFFSTEELFQIFKEK